MSAPTNSQIRYAGAQVSFSLIRCNYATSHLTSFHNICGITELGDVVIDALLFSCALHRYNLSNQGKFVFYI